MAIVKLMLLTQEDQAAFRDGRAPENVLVRTFASEHEAQAYEDGAEVYEDETDEIEALEMVDGGKAVGFQLVGEEWTVASFETAEQADAYKLGMEDAQGFISPLVVSPGDDGYDRLLAQASPIAVSRHEFDSTGEAYDACQVGDVKIGDILVIPSEQVVGVADTWPFAITAECGNLHGVSNLAAMRAEFPSMAEAERVATELGYPMPAAPGRGVAP